MLIPTIGMAYSSTFPSCEGVWIRPRESCREASSSSSSSHARCSPHPRLLLLDEPSLGLGPKIVDLIYDILAVLRASGLTLLIVEQSLDRVLDVADRIYVMRSGEIVLSGRSTDLRESAGLRQAYFGIDAAGSAA